MGSSTVDICRPTPALAARYPEPGQQSARDSLPLLDEAYRADLQLLADPPKPRELDQPTFESKEEAKAKNREQTSRVFLRIKESPLPT